MAMLRDDLERIVDARAQEGPVTDDIYAKASDYVGFQLSHKRRIAKLDALVNGDWGTLWPDGTVSQDLPKIADYITTDMEDLASLVAAVEPTTSVPPESDKPQDIRASTMLQNIIATYRMVNQYRLTRARLALDLVGTGLACLIIQPRWNQQAPQLSYPQYVRKDPRHVYPDPDLSHPMAVTSGVVAYRTKARVLAANFPFVRTALFTSRDNERWDTSDIEVLEYYDNEWCIKVCARRVSGERKPRLVELARYRNLLGSPMFLITARPTFDGQFRGQFDKAIAPLGTANKMMELHLAQLADEIYSEKIVRGVFDNPEDMGPGATLYTTDYQASIERAKPAGSHPQMYEDIRLLLAQSRESAGIPEARHGVVSQSIISGTGIDSLQGKYVTAVETYQGLLANLEMRANATALRVDEAYLDFPDKPLSGLAGGRSGEATYTPSEDIAGRYENRVVYGAGSGYDAYNRRLAVIQDIQYGLASRRSGREQLAYVEDVISEEAEINRERLEDGFITGLADPNTPLDQRMRALALSAEGKSVVEIAAIMDEEARQAAEKQTMMAAEQEELEAFAGGGAVGSEETEALNEAAALPSLQALRGGA